MPTLRPPRLIRRPSWVARLACGAAAGLAGLCASPHGLLPTGGRAYAASGTPAPAPLRLEALTAQAARQKEEVQRLDGELQVSRKAQQQSEQAAAQRAQEIERLKGEPAGVGRDLRLQELLAQAQAQSLVLAQQAGELRAKEASLRGGRERLLFTCDQILAADSGGKLPLSQRLEWLRLRTAQIEALHGAAERESLGQAVRTAVQAEAALAPYNSADAAGGDDPQILRERADLLRDSADKLRREVQRLKVRGDELSHRQRLRERAARVDEDLFAEQTRSRHLASSAGGNRESAATTTLGTPAPTAPGSFDKDTFTGPIPSAGSNVRSTLDPSALDILQRAETLTDPVAKLQALQRAQSELTALTDQLLARAARLEHRATELSHKK